MNMNHFLKLLKKSSRHKNLMQELQKTSELEMQFSEDLEANRALLERTFANCSDIIFQSVKLTDDTQILLVYVDGMIDRHHLEEGIRHVTLGSESIGKGEPTSSIAKQLEQSIIIGKIRTTDMVDELAKSVLSGEVAMIFKGERNVLIVGMIQSPSRNIEEPQAESLIRGPREGFIEQIRTNTVLLRKRLRTPRLKIELFTVGELTQTKVEVAYIDGIAPDFIVQEVRNRVTRIMMDGVIDSGYIEEFIEDMPYSPFPQVLNTERPDVVAGNLLEGKIAVLVDGSPSVLIVPMTFGSAMQSPEDYYERFIVGTFLRNIRFIFLFIALFLPSIYVAVSTFHPEMIPTNLLMSIAGAREASPFPALVEALLMEIAFEAIREAGVRLPKQVGSAVSIVGVLVIGQAAVQAGIASAPMVIVVSITGIASFAIPRFNFALSVRMLRFPLILVAGTLGLYGIGIGMLCILIHLSSLRSFGVPYFEPVSPLSLGKLKDVLIRAPHWAMKLRPELTGYLVPLRVPSGQKPGMNRAKKIDRKNGEQK